MLTSALVALCGCATAPIRTMDNGAAGKEEWSIPVLRLPALPSLLPAAGDCDA